MHNVGTTNFLLLAVFLFCSLVYRCGMIFREILVVQSASNDANASGHSIPASCEEHYFTSASNIMLIFFEKTVRIYLDKKACDSCIMNLICSSLTVYFII